ncbi:MAG: hypothetical protein KGQ66_18615 [Acidobacteriota bacterium]|nr:hypothetical protein [Acidobacteriota bacterium]
MVVLWWAVIVVVGGALLMATAYVGVMGGIGAAVGERFERCPRCGRHNLTGTEPLHFRGCPPPSAFEHLRHTAGSYAHLPRH